MLLSIQALCWRQLDDELQDGAKIRALLQAITLHRREGANGQPASEAESVASQSQDEVLLASELILS